MDEDTKKTADRRAILEAVLAITMESLVKPPEPEPEDMDPLKREKLLEDHYAELAFLETWRKERGKI